MTTKTLHTILMANSSTVMRLQSKILQEKEENVSWQASGINLLATSSAAFCISYWVKVRMGLQDINNTLPKVEIAVRMNKKAMQSTHCQSTYPPIII
jgi:hypothetical protein